MIRYFLNVTLLVALSQTIILGQDWANLERYRADNLRLKSMSSAKPRIVFMGNSITESWPKFAPDFFAQNLYIPRGISGQTTPQMLVRFRADVIDLNPAVVVILAGTNDIAGNTGPMTLEMIFGNIVSMVELARANHIKVVISSVLPAFQYPWKMELEPAEEIFALNSMLKKYSKEQGLIYLDYYTSMVDEKKGLKSAFTYDGVHPNLEGYRVMGPLAQNAIQRALKQKY